VDWMLRECGAPGTTRQGCPSAKGLVPAITLVLNITLSHTLCGLEMGNYGNVNAYAEVEIEDGLDADGSEHR
jgi:hypothetical protein